MRREAVGGETLIRAEYLFHERRSLRDIARSCAIKDGCSETTRYRNMELLRHCEAR